MKNAIFLFLFFLLGIPSLPAQDENKVYTTPLEIPAFKGGDEGGFSIPCLPVRQAPLGTPGFSPGGLHFLEQLKEHFNDYYSCCQENNLTYCRVKLISNIKALLGGYAKEQNTQVDNLQDLEKAINYIIQPLNYKAVLFIIPDSEIINCWLAKSVEEKTEEREMLGRHICADIIYMDNLIIRDYLYFSTQGKEMLDAGSKYSSIYFNLEAMRKRADSIWDFFQSREKESLSRRYAPSKLDRLRKHIHYNGWVGLYEEALQQNKDLKETRIHFIEKALKEIKGSFLLHELAHIYVQDNPKLKLNSRQEEEFAFLFEMSYGKMPFESLDTVVGIYAKGLKDIYYTAVENILNGFVDYIRQQQLANNPEYKGIVIRGNYLKDKLEYIYNLNDKQIREISGVLLGRFKDRFCKS